MAFMGLFIAGLFLIGAIFGFLFLIIGIIFDIVCIVRKKKQKRNRKVLIVFTVIFNVLGVLMFVVPVGGLILFGKISVWKEEKRLENIQYKVYVNDNEWTDGFEYKGMNLVEIGFIQAPKKEMLTEEGVVIRENGGDPLYIRSVDNEGGFDIYNVERFGRNYCDSKQYDDIYKYYHSPDNLKTSIEKSGDERKTLEIDFNPTIVFEIRDVYNNHNNGFVQGNIDDAEGRYVFVVKSKDGLFYESVWIVKYDGKYVLESTSSGESFSAYILPENIEDYLEKLLDSNS